jgi:F0F1-type ATP synthase gamma subunit
MKYFRDVLGTIDYNGTNVVNIFKNVDFDILKNDDFLDDYVIKDGDTPIRIALNLYGNADLFWIIMIINKMYNRFFDFPITTRVANKIKKDMLQMGYTTTEIDSFEEENDEKRIIKVLKPEFIQSFLFQLKDKVDGKA